MDILKELKRIRKNEGVIIISAKDSVDDKVNGLALGADDYLTKPFHTAELTARVKSVLRRKQFDGQNVTRIKNISIDFDKRELLVNGKEVTLNRKEFDILTFFVANKNRLVSKTALAEHVWGDQIDGADSYELIYSQIKNLRKKLKDHGSEMEIQAIYGIGSTRAQQICAAASVAPNLKVRDLSEPQVDALRAEGVLQAIEARY